jgi:hypothetical protein
MALLEAPSTTGAKGAESIYRRSGIFGMAARKFSVQTPLTDWRESAGKRNVEL